MAALIRVTQRRRSLGVKPTLRGTLRALGLRGIGSSNNVPDNEAVRGMIRKVSYLIDYEPAQGQ